MSNVIKAILDLPLKFLVVFILLALFVLVLAIGKLMISVADYTQTISLGVNKTAAPTTKALQTMAPTVTTLLAVVPPLLLFLLIAYKKKT